MDYEDDAKGCAVHLSNWALGEERTAETLKALVDEMNQRAVLGRTIPSEPEWSDHHQ